MKIDKLKLKIVCEDIFNYIENSKKLKALYDESFNNIAIVKNDILKLDELVNKIDIYKYKLFFNYFNIESGYLGCICEIIDINNKKNYYEIIFNTIFKNSINNTYNNKMSLKKFFQCFIDFEFKLIKRENEIEI